MYCLAQGGRVIVTQSATRSYDQPLASSLATRPAALKVQCCCSSRPHVFIEAILKNLTQNYEVHDEDKRTRKTAMKALYLIP